MPRKESSAMTNFAATSLLIICMTAGVAACTNPAVAITNRALDSHDTQAYNEYLRDAGRINIEREQAGLAPAPIMSRADWSGKK
jgi:hypothetical protein